MRNARRCTIRLAFVIWLNTWDRDTVSPQSAPSHSFPQLSLKSQLLSLYSYEVVQTLNCSPCIWSLHSAIHYVYTCQVNLSKSSVIQSLLLESLKALLTPNPIALHLAPSNFGQIYLLRLPRNPKVHWLYYFPLLGIPFYSWLFLSNCFHPSMPGPDVTSFKMLHFLLLLQKWAYHSLHTIALFNQTYGA